MVDPVYFLVNHSRREVWCFENKDSILEIVNMAVNKIKDWKITDNICIDSDCTCYGKIPQLGYKEIIV